MNPDAHINSLFSSVSYHLDGCLIDPGDCWKGFEDVSTILLTHAHFDHIYGLNKLAQRCSELIVYTNEKGQEMLLDAKKNLSFYHEMPFNFSKHDAIHIIQNGDEVILDNGLTAKAVFTPGHNPSCITWVIGDALFTGDSYIPGIKTVTNLPGGNRCQAKASEELIKQLSVGKTIYPGHKI